ncbi:MAG: nucleotide sugar dehydrogenase [Candidatus Omnitrophica bacterium]|nr:nucleotide sugar dehydrogenase [Candidatus Omnitrophota bacterium]
MKTCKEKIRSKKAKIAIVGLGYVGLPLAVGFAKKGFTVFGIDVDEKRISSIREGKSYILDIPSETLRRVVREKTLVPTKDCQKVRSSDIVVICVPTPLRKTKDPDLSFVISAVQSLAPFVHRGQLLILESTTYPGTTEEVILPLLESRGLKAGKDFCLCFSPERVDPGNSKYHTENIPKVVGGITRECSELGKLFYAQLIREVITVSSPRVAEMVKLLENTFRSVNIALVNELALMCHHLHLDVWEVIEAAKTKPFGFMPFYPGPGLGGHCIPIDPIYLLWKARLHGFEVRFIELATQINSYMPKHVSERTAEILNDARKPLQGSRILILGVSYKRNVNDTRESPALEILHHLKEKGSEVFYHDPYVPVLKLEKGQMKSSPLTDRFLRTIDCVVVVTDHTIDYQKIFEKSSLILDTRNALCHVKGKGAKVVKL